MQSLSLNWGVNDGYWYPLNPNSRSDVVAFSADDFETQFGFEKLRIILGQDKEIYEVTEWNQKGYQIIFESFEPQYGGDGEGYWFQENN